MSGPIKQHVAESIARQHWRLDVQSVEDLSGERDQNLLLTLTSGERVVLKLAREREGAEAIAAQTAALEWLSVRGADVHFPQVCATPSGETLVPHTQRDGSRWLVRMLTYLDGRPLAAVQGQSPSLLRELGSVLGTLDSALLGFSHDGTRRHLRWDLRHASEVIGRYAPYIESSESRRLVTRASEEFRERVAPARQQLRSSVIHSDANDYNVLVTGDGEDTRITGIVDFGDMVESTTAFELAIGAAYAILDKPSVLDALALVAQGYSQALALTPPECELLVDMVAARLAVSVSISAYESVNAPENAYLQISSGPACDALERLSTLDRSRADHLLRECCRVG